MPSLPFPARPKDLFHDIFACVEARPPATADDATQQAWTRRLDAAIRAWYCVSCARDLSDLDEQISRELGSVDADAARLAAGWVSSIIHREREELLAAGERCRQEAAPDDDAPHRPPLIDPRD